MRITSSADLPGYLRMLVDRDAAAIVGDGQPVARASRVTSIRVAWPATASSMHCRAPRRRDDEAPARRCRRYTCPAAGGRAPAPRAPRCNGRRNRRSCGRRKRTGRRTWTGYRPGGIAGARFLACSIHSRSTPIAFRAGRLGMSGGVRVLLPARAADAKYEGWAGRKAESSRRRKGCEGAKGAKKARSGGPGRREEAQIEAKGRAGLSLTANGPASC